MKRLTGMLCILIAVRVFAYDPVIPAKPKLVVGIVVDQMRYDFLYRYYNKYSNSGFKRLMQDGFVCKHHHLPYSQAITAVGHAAAYTGSIPAINGIVGNDWVNRVTGEKEYCVQDTSVKTVGSNNPKAGRMSPQNLMTTTITDQLRIASTFGNKVIGIALKDRGAILPAGHTANAAYWFDTKSGNWITSTYYMSELPAWVKQFNEKKYPAALLARKWETLLPLSAYTESTADDKPYETLIAGKKSPVFPYEFPAGADYSLFPFSPGGNTLTTDFSIRTIQEEQLGKGVKTDFLAISYSTPDYVGHMFGPNSIETEDIYLRLDAELARLLQYLDQQVGKNKYTVFLTADHGITESPGFAAENRLPGGNMELQKILEKIKKSLNEKWGVGDYITTVENYQVYLNRPLLKERNIEIKDVFAIIKAQIIAHPGVSDLFLLENSSSSGINDFLAERYRNSYYPKRSGDIQLVMQPGWIIGFPGGSATHGTPYNNDTQIPLVLFGKGIRKGSLLRDTRTTDLASTIASLLNILPPSGNVGSPITEALDTVNQ